MVMKWQNILENANLTKLENGGIVSKDIEKLEKYSESVEDYVGDYGKYFKALSGNSAPSTFVSFAALQAIAIFTFVFLV